MRLVGAEIPFRARPVRREDRQLGRRSAHQRGRRRGGEVIARRQRGDDPALGHGRHQRQADAVARGSHAQWPSGQPQRVALSHTVIEAERDDREDTRRGVIEDERLVERRIADRPTLRSEPARARDRLDVERGDRRQDIAARGSGDVSRLC
jgi:hypothetical protein